MKSWPTLMKIFLEILKDSFNDWNFFFFLRHHVTSGATFEKKKCCFFFFFQIFHKILNSRWRFLAEISADRPKIPPEIFFCPKYLPKKFWVKSDHYIILKSKKSYPPPEMAIFGGVRKLYVTYPNNNLKWQNLRPLFHKIKIKCKFVLKTKGF